MVSTRTAVSLATSIWYYYATNVDYVADSSHSWTLQPKVISDLACRAVCNADSTCLQYLVEVVRGAGTGCYTAAIDFDETGEISHSIKAGFIIAQKTSAVTFATYNFNTVQEAIQTLDEPSPGYIESYYLCFSTPTGAKTEDPSSTCGHAVPDDNHTRAADGSICNSVMPSIYDPTTIFSCNSKGAATSCLPGSGINGIKCTPCTLVSSLNQQKNYSVGGPGACQSCGAGSFCAKSTSPIINACDNNNGYGFNAAVASCTLCTGGSAKDSTSPCARLPICTDYSSICSTTTGFVLNCKPGYGFSGVSNTASANCLGCSKASLTFSLGGQKPCSLCQGIANGGTCDPTNGYLNYCPAPYPLFGTPATISAGCSGNACGPGYFTDGKSGCQQCDDPTSLCDANGDFAGCQNPAFRTSYCGCVDPALPIHCS